MRLTFFFLVLHISHQSLKTLCFRINRARTDPRTAVQLNLLDISRLTTIEVESYVNQGIAANGIAPIVIAIGATEQHGPTGLIGTDSQTSLAVARKVCEDCNVLLGPQIQVGMSLHHCGFAGSASLRPSTLVNVICDIVWSLHQSSKITHFYFINGHGGNVLPIKLAFAILRAKMLPPWSGPRESDQIEQLNSDSTAAKSTGLRASGDVAKSQEMGGLLESKENISPQQDLNQSPISTPADSVNSTAAVHDAILFNAGSASSSNCSTDLKSHFELSMVSWYANNDSQNLARSLYGDELGQHATPDEVAMTMYLFPELRKSAVLDPEVLKATPPGRTARRSEGGSALEVERIISGLLAGISDQDERSKISFLGKMALNHMDPEDFRKRFADGRMWSNPGLATEKHGKLLFETSTKSVIADFNNFVTKEKCVQ
jgi:creatinine amidohydrolase/Fe(II)-dependent formamide hydrolase-like protein